MAPTKRDPFNDLLLLQERISQIFDEAIIKFRGCSGSGAWYPPVDIYETEDNIVLKAEIPGIDINDISIEVNDNALVLKGERRHRKGVAEENYHRMERFYGGFQRVFSIPYPVERDSIKASFKDGILKITVPKAKERPSGGVKIAVQ